MSYIGENDETRERVVAWTHEHDYFSFTGHMISQIALLIDQEVAMAAGESDEY